MKPCPTTPQDIGYDGEVARDQAGSGLSAMDRVLETPELMGRVMGYLDNGEAKDLVRCLQVSRRWLHLAAHELCGRISVPMYEYSKTQTRDEVQYDQPCGCRDGGHSYMYRQIAGTTTHNSLRADHGISDFAESSNHYRMMYGPSDFMREMYRQVRVLTLEPHRACIDLAVRHPLQSVHTVITRGGHRATCKTTISSGRHYCSMLPDHPFRLILDDLCPALLCQHCTSPRLLNKKIETLVLRLRHEYHWQKSCVPFRLPPDCRPERLVLLFPAERFRKDQAMPTEGPGRWPHSSSRPKIPAARKPEDEKVEKQNWFYRIASVSLQVPDETEILIVGADRGGIYFRNLSQYDESLTGSAKAPQRIRPRPSWLPPRQPSDDEASEPGSDAYTSGCSDVAESDWSDDSGDYSRGFLARRNEKKKRKKIAEVEEAVKTVGRECNDYACYSQYGHLVSARIAPGRIPADQVPHVTQLVAKKVAVIESVLRAWIDELLDRTKAFQRSWQADKDQWEDRRDFERYHRYIVAEKELSERAVKARKNGEKSLKRYESRPYKMEGDPVVDLGDMWYDKPLMVEDTWTPGMGFSPTEEELKVRRATKQRRIRFITLHEYHKLEGNKDEMDDPALYL